MSRKPGKGDYEIGYGRPPAASRFKPGQSGNARGRPRKSQAPGSTPASSLDHLILAEANREIVVMTNGKKETLTTQQAVFRQLAAKSLKGDPRASASYLHKVQQAQDKIDAEWAEFERSLLDYATAWQVERRLRAAERPPRPAPGLHPDEIVPDRGRDRVLFNGPTTDAEAAGWRRPQRRVDDIAALLQGAEQTFDGLPDEVRAEAIRSLKAERDLLTAICPSPSTRRAPGFDLDRWRLERLKLLVKSNPPDRFLEPIRASGVIRALERRVHGERRRRK